MSAPSGEYLPRGSFLIKGRKNFVLHNLVELAVGIDAQGRLISGPESALVGKSVAYVLVRPQREKSSETAKRVRTELEKMAGDRPHHPITLDQILRAIPSGGGKILRRRTATAA